jgi:hypothetical protein
MTACVPGKSGHIVQAEIIDRFLPAAGMFMAAMKKNQRLAGR